jgi:hypothetical protein
VEFCRQSAKQVPKGLSLGLIFLLQPGELRNESHTAEIRELHRRRSRELLRGAE